MDCKNCEVKRRHFFCKNCLNAPLREYRSQFNHLASERDVHVAKATKDLTEIQGGRERRANVVSLERRVDELMEGLGRLREGNDAKRRRLQELREQLATRRSTLADARATPLTVPRDVTERDLVELSATVARARSGLVQELVEVFNIVEVGGRPPIGGKAGTKGEWTIGDLILPVPGDIRRYPPDHINAVVTHTIHFLSLLTFYLDVKLPFEISWSGAGGRLGVGTPWIGASKGGESGSWARWHTKHPLHLSSNATIIPSPSSLPTQAQALSDSYHEPPTQPQSSFTTALAMLIYNVSYLAFTQNVEIFLSQAGDVLRNLWSICCSVELGRKSHSSGAPGARLAPPTPPDFPLDFVQLLQATTANPAARPSRTRSSRRESRKVERIEEEDWDLVDGDDVKLA